MHPARHAVTHPTRPAIIMAESGETISFVELDQSSNQAAHLYRSLGCGFESRVAIVLENHPKIFEAAWGAQRAGLYIVCVPTHLKPSEVEYIVRDSGAKLLITSPKHAHLTSLVSDLERFIIGAPSDGFRSWEAELLRFPTSPIANERAGADMLYSSGTTGRPKGVRPHLPQDPSIFAPTPVSNLAAGLMGFDEQTIYLSPAPLYHAAPLRFSMAAQKLGGTVVVMEKFDAEKALALIATHRVTHSQWVPTHFVRMLRLTEEVRRRYDLSSHRIAIHAAAPCPIPVKEAMIKWWGPIIAEYYAGTETNGLTFINSKDWLAHKGSVGTAVIGSPNICDDNGEVLPPRAEGLIYFSGGNEFSYHNDPEKTAASRNSKGWTTLGDIGWLDEDGYLYLTDRQSFMIITGGVNVYPQEIENLLLTHPKILDAAVIGAPDPEMGEKVVAVIQPARWSDANDEFREELYAWLKQRLAGVKQPRQIDFRPELPRQPTGKLYKRLIKNEYWKPSSPSGS
jgi:long-chain acyl-CoA synthetase